MTTDSTSSAPVGTTPAAGATSTSTSTTTSPAAASSFFGQNPAAQTPAASNNDFGSFLPEEFKNDPTFKDYKTIPDFLKSHKNMASLVGKKVLERPGDNATPEQIAAYRKTIGVPDSVEGYQFEDVDLAKFGEHADGFKKELGDFKQIFIDAGIPAKEANMIQKAYWSKLGEALGKIGEQKAAQDEAVNAEFVKMTNEKYGDKAPQIIDNAKALMSEFATPKDVEVLSKLDNSTLLAMINTLQGVREKYIAEGTTPGSAMGQGSAKTAESISAEAKEKYAKLRAMDPSNPEYRTLNEEINALYAKLPK